MKDLVRTEQSNVAQDIEISSENLMILYSQILRWADQYELSRVSLLDQMQELAKARAAIENSTNPVYLASYSQIQKAIRSLLAKFYISLQNINYSLIDFNYVYKGLEDLGKTYQLNREQIHMVELFLSDRYRNMFDYDLEIEKLNREFDRLVQSCLRLT